MVSLSKGAQHSCLKKPHRKMCADNCSVATWKVNSRWIPVKEPNGGHPYCQSLLELIWCGCYKGNSQPRWPKTTQKMSLSQLQTRNRTSTK
eukprot:1356710-Amorphochlora_amoeboformis.AAC.1